MGINFDRLNDYAVNKAGKIVRYNPFLDDIVGYTKKRFYYDGEIIAVSMPVVKPISNIELLKRIGMGLVGAVMVYAFLVVSIGVAPLVR